ncbi:MAG: hypothetical protein H6557_31460 [Lewinellaceae bacterium]|nr:hypothetical protein [Phaeodactylibacter sp.]MCB9041164.1 hypothetical protein [Lewinellaceae bacterium]
MSAISFQTTNNKFLITIDRDLVDKDIILRLVENLRVEFLAHKVDVGPKVLEIGEDIKQSWWEKNKERLLNPEK